MTLKRRFKYYLQGAGIGILVAVLLYSTIVIPKYRLSDEEIIQKANELSIKQENDDVDLSALTMTPGPTPAQEQKTTPEPTPEQPEKPEKPEQPSPAMTGSSESEKSDKEPETPDLGMTKKVNPQPNLAI